VVAFLRGDKPGEFRDCESLGQVYERLLRYGWTGEQFNALEELLHFEGLNGSASVAKKEILAKLEEQTSSPQYVSGIIEKPKTDGEGVGSEIYPTGINPKVLNNQEKK
jgi:hypothetical protein